MNELAKSDKQETFLEFTERILTRINEDNWNLYHRLKSIKTKLQNDLEPKDSVNEQTKCVTLPQKIGDKLQCIENSQTEMCKLIEIIETFI